MTTGSSMVDYTAYFREVCDTFYRAANVAGKINYYFKTAGLTIRLCFAGPALMPSLTNAFEHLSVHPVSTPDLTILLWDNFSAGIPMPRLPWKVESYVPCKTAGCTDNDHIKFIFQNNHIKISYKLDENTYNILDKTLNIAVYHTENAQSISLSEKGAPLLEILHWWIADRDRYFVHAGAVGNSGGGVLLAGKGGKGKSMTALACLNSDLSYVGDDYCLISNSSSPHVHSIYCSGKVNVKDIGKLSFLSSAPNDAEGPDWGKALYFIPDSHPEKISPGFPLKAVLIPQVTHALETSFKRVKPSIAFRSVAPSTIFQLPAAENQVFKCLSKVVRQVPCYTLNIGTDISKIPATISELLCGQDQ
jgi:hypothetical protein